MSAYIVRDKETRDIVGIYFADTIADLAFAVDEIVDVPDCEYARLPPGGGIVWPHSKSWKIEDYASLDGTHEPDFGEMDISEAWQMAIREKLRWKSMIKHLKAHPPENALLKMIVVGAGENE